MGALRYSLATSVVACLVTRALVSVLIPVVSCSSYRHGQGSDSYSGTVYLVSFPPCVFVSHSSSSVFLALCILCPFPPVSSSLAPCRRCSWHCVSCVLSPLCLCLSLLVVGVPVSVFWSLHSLSWISFLMPIAWKAALHPLTLHHPPLSTLSRSHLFAASQLQCRGGHPSYSLHSWWKLSLAQVSIHSFLCRVVSFLVPIACHYYNVQCKIASANVISSSELSRWCDLLLYFTM